MCSKEEQTTREKVLVGGCNFQGCMTSVNEQSRVENIYKSFNFLVTQKPWHASSCAKSVQEVKCVQKKPCPCVNAQEQEVICICHQRRLNSRGTSSSECKFPIICENPPLLCLLHVYLCVVYFDQLLGAARTQKLVKHFFSCFQPFLFISNIFRQFRACNQQKTPEKEQNNVFMSTPQSWSTP